MLMLGGFEQHPSGSKAEVFQDIICSAPLFEQSDHGDVEGNQKETGGTIGVSRLIRVVFLVWGSSWAKFQELRAAEIGLKLPFGCCFKG